MNIYQIEITNDCQFTCVYCPRTKHMQRPIGTMSVQTIDRISEVITSKSVRLHHYGESLLAPNRTMYAIQRLKLFNPDLIVELNTNGELLTPDMTFELFHKGLDKINLSYHNEDSLKHIEDIWPEHRSRIEIMKIADPKTLPKFKRRMSKYKDMGYQVVLKQLRDLGQIKVDVKKSIIPNIPSCSFLDNQEFVVMWDGRVVTCCEVYEGLTEEVKGNIHDEDINFHNDIIRKCLTCEGYGNQDEETEKVEL